MNLSRVGEKGSCCSWTQQKPSYVPDPDPHPHPKNPKPPEEEKTHMDKSLAPVCGVTMDFEEEERTLATNLYTSQSPSTSTSCTLSVTTGKEGKIMEKAHWQPPCEQSMYME